MNRFLIDRIAAELIAAQDAAQHITPFSGRRAEFDRDAAYAVAERIHGHRVAKGARPIGRKIGFSNRTIWPRYGVYEPIWAHVYDTTTTIAASRWVQGVGAFTEPRIEPEIVVHFGRTPESAEAHAILECVDWLALGFEIVQSHYPGWRFEAADTIADSGLHGALIVGPRLPVHERGTALVEAIASVAVELYHGPDLRERGSGSNVLESPLNAVAHLMSVLSTQPWAPRLVAGELVTTGTLTDAWPIVPGETWTATVSGLPLDPLSVSIVQ
jgi:2-oxo-3-hexenedioate decarboxylase